jgi:hypothetical protein
MKLHSRISSLEKRINKSISNSYRICLTFPDNDESTPIWIYNGELYKGTKDQLKKYTAANRSKNGLPRKVYALPNTSLVHLPVRTFTTEDNGNM